MRTCKECDAVLADMGMRGRPEEFCDDGCRREWNRAYHDRYNRTRRPKHYARSLMRALRNKRKEHAEGGK